MAQDVRDGRGTKAWRRACARAKRDPANWTCAWCGKPIPKDAPPNSPLEWTGDHTIPLAAGGKLNTKPVPMHRKCNGMKGTAIPVKLRDAS